MPSPFAFRMRAYAAAHFAYGEVMTVTWPDAEAKLQSEYTGGEDGRCYAVTIHGEIRGRGESIEEAEPRLSVSIGNSLIVIAVAANAAIADPLAVAMHGLDLSEPQPLLYYRTPPAHSWFPPGKRRIAAEATSRLMHAVGHHEQTDLMMRAMEAYRRALGYWTPESQLMAGEFLFIAAETLSRCMIEARASVRKMTPKNLARAEGANGERALRRKYLEQEIFASDIEALGALEEASNGFEHGYMSLEDVKGLLLPVLERSMTLVRRALVIESGVDDAAATELLSPSFDQPRGLVPVMMVVRGQISRLDTSQPPQPLDGAAIEFDWAPSPPPIVARGEDGSLNLSFNENVTVTALPENVGVELFGFGVRVAHVKPSSPLVVDVEVKKAGDGT